MGKLHHPHDQFFKIMLSDLSAAKAFIGKFLPARVTKLLDLSTLRITDHTFLSDEMSSQFADLIFECALKSSDNVKIWISLLYEHKSAPEEFALIQVSHYLTGGYRKQIIEGKKRLQLIVPIIYYHGTQEWEPKKVEDLFEHYISDLHIFVPDFEFIFQNLKLIADREIKDLENHLLVPGLFMQKYFKDLEKLKDLLGEIFYQLSLIEDEWNYKKNYFVYIFDLFGEENKELMKHIEELELPVRDRTKNYILQLEEKGWLEGREEGKKEGKEEGFAEAIKRLIKNGSTTSFICDVMDVTADYVERIRASMGQE